VKNYIRLLLAMVVLLPCSLLRAEEPKLGKADFELLSVKKDVKDLKEKVDRHDRLLDALLKKDSAGKAFVPTAEKPPVQLAAACAVWVGDFGAGGSGTVVACEQGRSLVVTNQHVVNGYQDVHVDCGGKRYPGKVVSVAQAADLAVVVVEAELPVAKLAEAEPPRGAKVVQWGCDARGNFRMVTKEGVFLGVNGNRFQSTIESWSGDSGCGVFDEQGRLVAVNYGFGGDYQHRGPQLGVALGDLVGFLRGATRDAFPRFAAGLDGVRGGPPAVAASTPKTASAVKWFGYAEGHKLAAETGKPVFVLFTSPEACVYCKKLEAGALKDPTLLKELEGYVCIKVDVTKDLDVMEKYASLGLAVTLYPTIEVYKDMKRTQILRSRNGRMVWEGRLTGNVDAGSILEQMGLVPAQQHSAATPFLNCGPTG
jgi:hypothetical protein